MIPNFATQRLFLTPFNPEDGERVELLAGNAAVARTTLNIPHPYPQGTARLWIATHLNSFLKGESVVFAIRLKSELIGCVSLGITRTDERAELGYWLGEPYWNQGYATEAARACADYGFIALRLNKITSRHFANNPASGRVMVKIGMKPEGQLRAHVKKADMFHDVIEYGILRTDWPGLDTVG